MNVIPANKLSLQKLNKLIGIKLLTSGLSDFLDLSPISWGGKCPFWPPSDLRAHFGPLRTPMVGKDITFAVMIKKLKNKFGGVSKGAISKHFVFLLFKPLFYLSTLKIGRASCRERV